MKKVFRTILVFTMAIAMIIGCGANMYAASSNYQGLTGDTSVLAINFNFNINLDFDWFVLGDNTVYSPDLAKLACVSCNADYGKSGVVLGKKTNGNGTKFFEALGLQNVEFTEVGASAGIDANDTSAVMLGHKKYTYKNKNYEIIFVSVRGSVTYSDWMSNFDMGYDCPEYYAETGEHPEWTNKDHHKGFDVAANRVYATVEDYVSSNTDSSCEKIYFVTGHSRGGAIANILGTYYENRDDVKSFTYTVAAPCVTTVSREVCDSYKTILNLINLDDMVTYCMPEEWGGFKLYGQNFQLTGADYADEFKSLTGKRYVGDTNQAVRLSYIGTETYTREEAYFAESDDSGYGILVKKFFDGSIINWHMPAIYYVLFQRDLNTSGRSFMPSESASVFAEPSGYIIIGLMAIVSIALITSRKKKTK